eukprot:TRINITY_DN20151_c0_g1_i2.p1 TRINITY_DN20151_c0_g1~~TRINITY_DN20151_c0_g1_i2.p1  ORF type:complete len:489 (+),score=82.36 TRINITY_DN20151_c0_g1_i2:60-1526(+)
MVRGCVEVVLLLLWVGSVVEGAVEFSGPPPKKSDTFSPYFYCNETEPGTIECSLDGEIKTYINKDDKVISVSDPTWWLDFGISSLLVCTSGIMSGLTIGLMGLDLTNLEVVRKTGTPEERKYAKRIIPILKRHHLLLCTLLLCNAGALEALPIFLEHLVPSVAAIIISVTLILFFGEVIPQALCTRWGLAIGAHLSYFVWAIMILTFPISWPISKILDFAIGTGHGTYFNRAELKELVTLHGERLKNVKDDGEIPHDALSYNEVTIIRGALDLSSKTITKCLTPLEETFMLSMDDILDQDKMALIIEKGHSRIPIYRGERSHIVGMILTKDLIHHQLGNLKNIPVSTLVIRKMPMAYSAMPVYKLLDIFRNGASHMAVVIDDNDHTSPIGIITLEDILEELIQEDIEDESDLKRKGRLAKQTTPTKNVEDEDTNGTTERRLSLDDYEQTDINSVYWAEDEDDGGALGKESGITALFTKAKRSIQKLYS